MEERAASWTGLAKPTRSRELVSIATAMQFTMIYVNIIEENYFLVVMGT